MAISLILAYSMNLVVLRGSSTTTRADESAETATARTVGGAASGGGAWVVNVGHNCWLPDPSGLEYCGSEPGAKDH
jgi:hypothetical protein